MTNAKGIPWKPIIGFFAVLFAVGTIASIDLPDDEYSWSGAKWRVGQTKHNATLIGTENGGFLGTDYAVFDFGNVNEESIASLPDGSTIILSLVRPKKGYIVYTIKDWKEVVT